MKTERFEMRLDPQMVQRVDDWRMEQPDMPSRAEAMRRLADTGLAVLGDGSIKVSHGETLILAMLRELYDHLKVKDSEMDPQFVEEAIAGGHFWALAWKYGGLIHGHADREEDVKEVVDVLDTWSFIESGHARLSDEEKREVEEKVGPRGRHVEFRGFDGNNEFKHLDISRFLINRLDRFTTFKDRDLNSHFPTLKRYRRMCEIFGPMRENLVGRELSCPEIIKLLKA